MNLDSKITGIAQIKNKSEKEPGINSHIQMPKFTEEHIADEMNCFAMQEQIQLGYGRVVSNRRDILEKISGMM